MIKKDKIGESMKYPASIVFHFSSKKVYLRKQRTEKLKKIDEQSTM